MDKLLTPNEAAELLMVSPVTIRSWANKGLLPASVTAGGHRRYSREALLAFARERGMALSESKDSHKKIMIIDDDASFAGMLSSYLQLRLPSSEVKLAGSGFEAGRFLGVFEPDVIILDLLMPGMSGYETSRMIKDTGSNPGAKIIAITGDFNPDTEREALDAGADACLGKPIDIDALMAHIND